MLDYLIIMHPNIQKLPGIKTYFYCNDVDILLDDSVIATFDMSFVWVIQCNRRFTISEPAVPMLGPFWPAITNHSRTPNDISSVIDTKHLLLLTKIWFWKPAPRSECMQVHVSVSVSDKQDKWFYNHSMTMILYQIDSAATLWHINISQQSKSTWYWSEQFKSPPLVPHIYASVNRTWFRKHRLRNGSHFVQEMC